jgi:hypothetical protein
MIQPPPKSAKPPVSRRPARTWLSANPDTRAVQIGVLATIGLHVLLLVLAPKIERFLDTRDTAPASDDWKSREFQVDYVPSQTVSEPPEVKLPEFVEANPNAPDNMPDDTHLVASQNQQVAQETPSTESNTDKPASKGDPTTDSTALVSGMQVDPTPPAPRPAPAANEPETAAQEAARREQTPLPGMEKFTGEAPDGVGSNVSPTLPNAAPVPERVEGMPDSPNTSGPRVGLYYSSTVNASKPKPRPTLAPDVVRARPSPLANREFGTDNIGAVAYNAKWSAYGEYLQKFIESVDVQWQRIIGQSNIYPVAGTKVVVKFRMNTKGEIYEIVDVQSTGGRAAKDACVSAIVARAPYGDWPEDMIDVLGQSQEITFTFHYN